MAGLLIPPPDFTLAPYGLLSLRDPDLMLDEHWIGGFEYESRSCTSTVNLLDVCGGADPVNVITPPPLADRNHKFTPYVVEAVDECSTFGFEARHYEERAVEALEACTQKAVENELWTGALAQANGYTDNRYLASTASEDITPGGGPVKLKYGLALLEGALGNCGCGTQGTIHVPREVGSVIPAKEVNGHLETNLGNLIVAGAGYTGSGPDGSVPGTGTWLYATGPVLVLLGPSELVTMKPAEQVNRATNTWTARAQRPAAAIWDGCCAFAVHVDLTLDYA